MKMHPDLPDDVKGYCRHYMTVLDSAARRLVELVKRVQGMRDDAAYSNVPPNGYFFELCRVVDFHDRMLGWSTMLSQVEQEFYEKVEQTLLMRGWSWIHVECSSDKMPSGLSGEIESRIVGELGARFLTSTYRHSLHQPLHVIRGSISFRITP